MPKMTVTHSPLKIQFEHSIHVLENIQSFK
jgi:hypothetical protein